MNTNTIRSRKKSKRRREAVAAFVADIQKSAIRSYGGFGISAFNYGLDSDEELITELRTEFPELSISTRGFMGYIHFEARS